MILELIITMLGEATTTHITQQKNSQGIIKLRNDAKQGGSFAGRTRRDLELQIGKSVISKGSISQIKNHTRKIEESI